MENELYMVIAGPVKHKKCVGRDNGSDLISRIPDELLVLILSRLHLKEAGRTSILSSRWINLWKYTLCLNFDAAFDLDFIAKNWKQEGLLQFERCRYLNWVNSVIRAHKGLTLEEFRICFDFDKYSHTAITRWLEFAFERKVERLSLELDFTRFGNDTYVFPVNFLSRMTAGTSTPFDVKALKALCLKSVDVTDEAIEFFLHNCPLIEQLIIHNSSKLSQLIVDGSSLMLKHLEIIGCYMLKMIMVSAPNLTSLKLSDMYGILLVNVPMLVDVSVYFVNDETYENKFVPALLGIPQLEILTMSLETLTDNNKAWKFPELPKLTKLEIIHLAYGDESLMGLTSFIEASPYLQEFVFKMEWGRLLLRTKRETQSSTQFRHQHLKVIKFTGYYGRASDLELIRYVLESCVVLEKIIIDPHFKSVYFPRAPLKPHQVEEECTARICAKQQLEAEVPSHVELVIL